jgi:tryptophan synthase beta subunit
VAYAVKLAPTMGKDRIVVVNLSGRGDKDAGIIEESAGGGAVHEAD